MPINSINYYFKQFERCREISGVPKEPLSASYRDGLVDSLEMNFRNTMARDNGRDDLDPLEGSVLSLSPQGVGSATYSLDRQGKRLRLHSVEGDRHFLSESHLCDRSLNILSFVSTPGVGGTLLCFHSDLLEPEKDFLQKLDLPS